MTVNVNDWSETPGSNTTIDGNSIAENCTPGVLNNALRSLMAGVRTFKIAYDTTAALLANYMPKAGGAFTGTQPIYTGEGAVLHNLSSSHASGKIAILPVGSARPASPANGDWVFYYTP